MTFDAPKLQKMDTQPEQKSESNRGFSRRNFIKLMIGAGTAVVFGSGRQPQQLTPEQQRLIDQERRPERLKKLPELRQRFLDAREDLLSGRTFPIENLKRVRLAFLEYWQEATDLAVDGELPTLNTEVKMTAWMTVPGESGQKTFFRQFLESKEDALWAGNLEEKKTEYFEPYPSLAQAPNQYHLLTAKDREYQHQLFEFSANTNATFSEDEKQNFAELIPEGIRQKLMKLLTSRGLKYGEEILSRADSQTLKIVRVSRGFSTTFVQEKMDSKSVQSFRKSGKRPTNLISADSRLTIHLSTGIQIETELQVTQANGMKLTIPLVTTINDLVREGLTAPQEENYAHGVHINISPEVMKFSWGQDLKDAQEVLKEIQELAKR